MSTQFLPLPTQNTPIQSLIASLQVKIPQNPILTSLTDQNDLSTVITQLSLIKDLLIEDPRLYLQSFTILSLLASQHNETPIIQTLITQAESLPEPFFSLKIRCLASLFNAIPPSNPLQQTLFLQILKLAESQRKISIIQPTLESLDQHIALWGLQNDLPAKRNLYKRVSEALLESKREKLASEAFIKYLNTLENPEQDLGFLQKTLIRFLNMENPHFELFESILALDPKFLDLRVRNLLVLYVKGDLKGYFTWLEGGKEYLEKGLELNSKQLEMKIRIKCLASCDETPSRPLSFEEIAKKLFVGVEEVEDWVIRGVQNGIIEGKIDEFRKVVEIQDNSSKFLEKIDVEKMEKRIGELVGVFEGYLDGLRKKNKA